MKVRTACVHWCLWCFLMFHPLCPTLSLQASWGFHPIPKPPHLHRQKPAKRPPPRRCPKSRPWPGCFARPTWNGCRPPAAGSLRTSKRQKTIGSLEGVDAGKSSNGNVPMFPLKRPGISGNFPSYTPPGSSGVFDCHGPVMNLRRNPLVNTKIIQDSWDLWMWRTMPMENMANKK